MRRLDSITNSVNGHEFEQLQETVKDKEAWHIHGMAKSQTQLSNLTTITSGGKRELDYC